MNETMRVRNGFLTAVFVAATGLFGTQALAVDLASFKETIKETAGLDGIEWHTKIQYESAVLVVTGPEGYRFERTFGAGDSLFLAYADVTRDNRSNGQYHYELTLSPQLRAADRALAREARALGEDVGFLAGSAPTIAGVFTVADGVVADRHLAETTESEKLLHADNVYIDGSLCVGNDCVNNSAFGFDTIRLEENNLRIKFQDTSVAAAFPPNDWQIVINDSTNGGSSYFAVEDFSAGRQVFRVFAGARSNALVVDSGGDVGLGTATPVLDLHVKTGDSPGLRLEQDGSSGFTEQTWDVVGNEANFFVRDATGGSALPLRIEPGSPTNSLYIETSGGDVGMGTNQPEAELHIVDNGAVQLRLDNTSSGVAWNLNASNANGGEFRIAEAGAGTGVAMALKPTTGNMEIKGTCLEFDNGGAPIACTAAVGSFTCAAGNCP